jgi:predicted GIY-YIG superfamily endonuclease
MKPKFTVYQIRVEIGGVDTIVYYGYTSRALQIREDEHNEGIMSRAKSTKELYQKLRKLGIYKVKLEPLYEFDNKKDATYKEMWLILEKYFSGNNTLFQKVPAISDAPEWGYKHKSNTIKTIFNNL